MNRTKCQVVAKDVEAAIADVLAKHNLEMTGHKGKYTDVSYTLTLNLTERADIEGLSYNPNTEEARMWTLCAPSHLTDKLGQTFKAQGQTFTIIGWRHRAPKRPILCESNGKQFVFPVAAVVKAFADNTMSRKIAERD